MEQSGKTVCGFVGIGSQGGPIARRIVDGGFPLVLWARRSATLDPFRDCAADIALTIADLAARADHLGICVSDDGAVLEVCGAALPHMRAASRIVIHSTTMPDTCRQIAREAAARGVAFVEAPVSGGGLAAAAGTLTVMTAGDGANVEAALPVFRTFASTILHLGEPGAAQTAKLINNSLLAANMGLARSAIEIGESLGLDRDLLRQALGLSSGNSYALGVVGRVPAGGHFSQAETLRDKIRLLGEVAGADDPNVRALDLAASRIP